MKGWDCYRCGGFIVCGVDEDPHSDPWTGEDVHATCCAACLPHLADRWGLTLAITTEDIVDQLVVSTALTSRPVLVGHGVLSQAQSARGEARRGGTRG